MQWHIYNHERLRDSKSKLLRCLRSFIDLFWQMKNSKHNIEKLSDVQKVIVYEVCVIEYIQFDQVFSRFAKPDFIFGKSFKAQFYRCYRYEHFCPEAFFFLTSLWRNKFSVEQKFKNSPGQKILAEQFRRSWNFYIFVSQNYVGSQICSTNQMGKWKTFT